MSVYVDDMRAPFGRMVICHMIADTSAELHAMAAHIGVARKWCQKEGTPDEHYDICQAKRAAAIRIGALEISWSKTGEIVWYRREIAAGRLAEPPLVPAQDSPFGRPFGVRP